MNNDREDTIKQSVVNVLERMKKLDPVSRAQLCIEFGEWIFNKLDIDEELFVSQVLKESGR